MRDLNAIVPDWRSLRSAARAVRQNAWAPYSNYSVGAALLTADGTISTGCNVENASYGLTICAERNALHAAVSLGHREFRAICISLTGVAIPCGACRQVLYEFSPSLIVIMDDLSRPEPELPEAVVLNELLPRGFRLVR
jgi:cytidine deaminase